MITEPKPYQIENKLDALAAKLTEFTQAANTESSVKAAAKQTADLVKETPTHLKQVLSLAANKRAAFVEKQIESLVSTRDNLRSALQAPHIGKSFSTPGTKQIGEFDTTDIETLTSEEQALLTHFDQVIRDVRNYAEGF